MNMKTPHLNIHKINLNLNVQKQKIKNGCKMLCGLVDEWTVT